MPRIAQLITVSVATAVWFIAVVAAQTLSGPALVAALQGGGHVIVMRHASSPSAVPDRPSANADNVTLERQLDERGRASAAAMGEALRRLKIPIGEVLTSDAYRTRETARAMRLTNARPAAELGEANQSMQGASRAQIAWLQKKVRDLPRGSNTLLITHSPNISGAFSEAGSIADGEALVFGPDGKGGARVVARVTIDEWPDL